MGGYGVSRQIGFVALALLGKSRLKGVWFPFQAQETSGKCSLFHLKLMT